MDQIATSEIWHRQRNLEERFLAFGQGRRKVIFLNQIIWDTRGFISSSRGDFDIISFQFCLGFWGGY